jgi:phosphate-selective porin OprO/OprP
VLIAFLLAADLSLAAEVENYLERNPPVAMEAHWANRIRFESADGDFRFDLIGWILWDNVAPQSEDFDVEFSTFFRSVRIGAQGHAFRNTVYKLQLEFAGGQVGLRDVFVGLGRNGPSAIAGHFKEPFGFEFLVPLSAIFFTERSEPTRAFVPDRNSGIMLSSNEAYNLGPRAPGGWFAQRMVWAIGLFRTSNNQGFSTGNGGWSGTGRIAGLAIDREATRLHLGVAVTHRHDKTVRYFADGFLVDTGPMSVSSSTRLCAELVYIRGGFTVSAEYFWTREDQIGIADTSFSGAYVTIGFWVTGEEQAWNQDRFVPTAPVRRLLPGGVWIGYRFDYLDLNDGAVQGGEQAQHTLGINWAWNWNTRLMLNYTYVDIDSGPEGPGALHIFALRTQFNF